jgi:hypothetical protein
LWFWLGIGILSLIWSLGDVIPINRWLVTLPGFNLLRVPARGLYFLGFALLIIAMISLDSLIKRNPQKAIFLRLGTIFITTLVVLIQVFIVSAKPDKNMFLIWHAVFWIILASVVLCFSYRKITGNIFLALLGIAALADIAFSDVNLIYFRSESVALLDGYIEVKSIRETKMDFREFSPSYSIPQHTAAYYGLELADGIDPLQLRNYSEFVQLANSRLPDGYSVTLPPFENGNPIVDNIGIKPDAKTFGLLNVKYLVSAFPITMNDWELVKRTKNSYVYFNRLVRGWAWVETNSSSKLDEYRKIEKIARLANHIELEVIGPGKLVLSEINYPGWQVSVDGQPAVIQTAHSVLRSVELGEGHHMVEFRYVPYRVLIGAGISLITIIFSIFICRVKKIHA